MMKLLPYVISSRVRLARNIKQYRFPHAANAEERQAVFNRLCQIMQSDPRFEYAELLPLDDLTPLERKTLEEQQVISHNLINPGISRLVIIGKTTNTSILVNEEDHLRIQCCLPGFQPQEAWQRAAELEISLAQHLDFAYSRHYGYLTSCPRNAGLGLRVSVMLFLPGLIMLKRIKPLISQYTSTGYIFRGRYGEGSESQGYILQLSNQRPEEHHACRILQDLQIVCQRIVTQEKQARRYLRSYGSLFFRRQLQHTRRIVFAAQALDVPTSMRILAIYRLAIALGLLSLSREQDRPLRAQCDRDLQHIDLLANQIQPAHILQYSLRRPQQVTADGYGRREENAENIRANLLRRQLKIEG